MVRVVSARDAARFVTNYALPCRVFFACAVRASFRVDTVCTDVVVFLALVAPSGHSDIFVDIYDFALNSNVFL